LHRSVDADTGLGELLLKGGREVGHGGRRRKCGGFASGERLEGSGRSSGTCDGRRGKREGEKGENGQCQESEGQWREKRKRNAPEAAAAPAAVVVVVAAVVT
jgi:hypothetical protein